MSYFEEIKRDIAKKGLKLSFIADKAKVSPQWLNKFLDGDIKGINQRVINVFKVLNKYVDAKYKSIDINKFFSK